MRSLYLMKANLDKGEVNVMHDSSIDLWHKRLGQLSEKGIQTLVLKQLLPKVIGNVLKSCVDCIYGKQHRVEFQHFSPSRQSNALDLVHTHVCYMGDRSLGGAMHFVTFTDDFSIIVWCFPLKSKDQVLKMFKDFHNKVEREKGKQLKCVWVKNGGEYKGRFESYCRLHGIRVEKTVLKTPHENGVAKRMNRSITERV